MKRFQIEIRQKREYGVRLVFAMILGIYLFFTSEGGVLAALPDGGTIISGSGAISPIVDDNLTVTQSSKAMIIEWNDFSIGEGNAVHFDQAFGADSVALNRVVGADPSTILGTLTAPGQIFIVNPQGVLFGENAEVEVGSLVASTLALRNNAFLDGDYVFTDGSGTGTVVNKGTINVADGGYVALIAPQATNADSGRITARLGTVAMGAGNEVKLELLGDGLVDLEIDGSLAGALLTNEGRLYADGGLVLFEVGAKADPTDLVVNLEAGVVRANSAELKDGRIVLSGGDQGNVRLIASSMTAAGGIDVTGEQISLRSMNYFSSKRPVSMRADGDIVIEGTLVKDGAGDLRLRADASGTDTGTVTVDDASGSVDMNDGADLEILYNPIDPGGGAHRYTNPTSYEDSVDLDGGSLTAYMLVNHSDDLQSIAENLDGTYALGSDMDTSDTKGWNAGAGFAPIGSPGGPFTGLLDGRGHAIDGLVINRPGTDWVGLFSRVGADGEVRNVALTDLRISGRDYVGGLAGSNLGTLTGSSAAGSVSGHHFVGGMAGVNEGTVTGSETSVTVTGTGNNIGGLVGQGKVDGSISESHSSSSVSSDGVRIGGLVGENFGAVSDSYSTGIVAAGGHSAGGLLGYNSGAVNNVYSTGTVGGSYSVGGLIGDNSGDVGNTYSTGTVTSGGFNVGGLIGNNKGDVSNGYSTGTVTGGGNNVGGLIGNNAGDISDSHSEGAVTGLGTNTGGLAGQSLAAGSVSRSYSTGKVTGGANLGGLIGLNSGIITDSYAAGDVISSSKDVGGLVGVNQGEVSNSYSLGNVTADGIQLGGLVGWNSGTISRSYAKGDVIGKSDTVGGLIGTNGVTGTVDESYGTGRVTSSGVNLGGLIGENWGNVSASYSTSIVIGAGSRIGGLIGNHADGRIEGSYSTGSVEGAGDYVGGLIGRNLSDAQGSYSTGNVKGDGAAVGGLVGVNYGEISRSFATGDVIGKGQSVGGLIGENSGNVTETYSTGAVIGASDRVGGLIGYFSDGIVQFSYSLSPVKGTDDVGGLIGRSTVTSSVRDSYSAGAVWGSGSDVGGLVGAVVGFGTGEVAQRSFWNVTTSGQTASAPGLGAVGLESGQMMNEEIFAAWDATSWRIVHGISYPYLDWQFGGEAPTVLRGTVTDVEGNVGTAGGIGVGAAIDGGLIGSTYTGVDGFYYFATDPRDAGAALAWLDGNRFGEDALGAARGNAVTALSPEGHAADLEVAAGRLAIDTDLTAMSSVVSDLLQRALGDDPEEAVENGAVYTVTGAAPTLDPGIDFHVRASGDFSVDTSVGTDGGDILVHSGGDIVIADGTSLTSDASGDAVVLAAGGDFVNWAGPGAIVTTGGGRWLIWSDGPDGDARGGLVHAFRQYGATHGESDVLGVGNGFLYEFAPEVRVALVGEARKVYDGDTDAVLSAGNFAVVGALAGETVELAGLPVTGQYENADAGDDKQLTVDISGVSIDKATDGAVVIYGYRIDPDARSVSEAIGTITPATLTVTVADVSRPYGKENPAFTASYEGFQLGDDTGVLGGALSFETVANISSQPGTYRVTASGLSARNYEIEYVDGVLRVLIPNSDVFQVPGLPDRAYLAALWSFYDAALDSYDADQ